VKKGFTTCAECEEYPCERYSRRGWGTDQWSQTAQESLNSIKKIGMEDWLEKQRRRRLLLEDLLASYNDGRSMSFYCLATILMPPELINEAVNKLKKRLASNQLSSSDIKAKAKSLRKIIQDLAQQHGIELRLSQKGG